MFVGTSGLALATTPEFRIRLSIRYNAAAIYPTILLLPLGRERVDEEQYTMDCRYGSLGSVFTTTF